MIDPELSDDRQVIDSRTLRQFAGLWLVFLSGLAGWHAWHGHTTRSVVFGLAALVIGPTGLVAPEAIRPLFTILVAVTRPIGFVMTRVILRVLFYGLFTPIGVVFKLIGRDSLAPRRPAVNTYWRPRDSETEARRYLRQY